MSSERHFDYETTILVHTRRKIIYEFYTTKHMLTLKLKKSLQKTHQDQNPGIAIVGKLWRNTCA